MKALVIGSGKSGKAAAGLLAEGGADVEFANGFDVVVASPGVRVVSELQFGCESLRERGWKLLAATGSKGKSSVVKVVADAIALTGQTAVACGNYGVAVSEVAKRKEVGWAVVEVSSFMLETTSLGPDTFEAAAMLNLQADHLDRHGTLEAYHAIKRRLLTMTRTPIDGTQLTKTSEGEERKIFAGSYFDNEILVGNAKCAVALMRAAGVNEAAMRRAFEQFEPLAHRMNVVAVEDGVKYIDDSKATSIAALIAGVTMCNAPVERTETPFVRLIAGGQAKGDDPKNALSILTKRVKKVYLIGCCAGLYSSAWSKAVDCEICETMERAVQAVQREVANGETVLLSPGTASYDQFNNFEERGDCFARLVKKERKKK